MNRNEIFDLIEEERERQEILHPFPNLKPNSPDEATLIRNFILIQEMLAVLIEEVGEVGKAIQLDGEGDLKEELIQVASVCVRWLENMN